MIKIVVTEEGFPLVWDSEDWLKLREEHRIVGKLIGSLVNFPHQEGFQGLPLALMPEEATLLVEKEIAQLVRYPSLSRTPGRGVRLEYEKYRKRICEEQLQCLVEGRKKKVTEMIDSIVEGKRRKALGIATKGSKRRKKKTEVTPESSPTENEEEVINKDDVLKEELDKIKTPPVNCTSIQVFSTYPWLRQEDECKVKWKYPTTPTEILSYKVFKDFWEQGYYLTSAQKFGGDFLVYSGDPFKFHALYLVICIDVDATIRPVDIATFGRLGSSVRKTVVLASCNEDKLSYQSIAWNGFCTNNQNRRDNENSTI